MPAALESLMEASSWRAESIGFPCDLVRMAEKQKPPTGK